MKLAHFTQDYEWFTGEKVKADESYLVDDSRGSFLELNVAECRVADFPTNYDPSQDYNGKTILMMRAGGFGDLLFLTPTLDTMKLKWPKARLIVGARIDLMEALENNPDCETVPYPIHSSVAAQADAILSFDYILEFNEKAKTVHAVDLFAERAGMELTDKKAKFFLKKDNVNWAQRKFPRNEKKRLGVQIHASAPCRTYNIEQLGFVMSSLIYEGWEVFTFGEPLKIKCADKMPHLYNMSERALDFHYSAAVMSTCDVFLGPDSGLVHLAGALDIPTVALYGPYPWQLRTAYHPSIRAIQGYGDCSPCFHQPIETDFPKGKPCEKAGECVVLRNIDPARIIQQIKKCLS